MFNPLRILIVDDEAAAVRRLSRLCEAIGTVLVVATAADGELALMILSNTTIDLILLDIEMPGMSGLAMAERLTGCAASPAIVFVTAFEQFAIAAFAVDALGYLLKPVDPALLAQTLERVTRRVVAKSTDPIENPVFWVPHRGNLMRLAVDDIDYVQAEGDYSRLHVGEASYLVTERLYTLEARLSTVGFMRTHRSILVNSQRIKGLSHEGSGAWSLLTLAGVRLSIGRSFLSAVRSALAVSKQF